MTDEERRAARIAYLRQWRIDNAEYVKAKRQEKKPPPPPARLCDICGRCFLPDRRTARYCSAQCSRRDSRLSQTKQCERCGADFRPRTREQRFCASRCAYASRKRKLTPHTCPVCRKSFQPVQARVVTCSRACQAALRFAKVREANLRRCEECGVTFTPKCMASCRYCSRTCAAVVKSRTQNRKVQLACETCGKAFLAKPSRAAEGARFCSVACHQASPEHPLTAYQVRAGAAVDYLRKVGAYTDGPLATTAIRRAAALAYLRKSGLL